MSIVFHSALKSFDISPVRRFGLSAATSGRRLRAKIIKAFMGRLGVPSGLITVRRESMMITYIGSIDTNVVQSKGPHAFLSSDQL